jgi:hypothetical protein
MSAWFRPAWSQVGWTKRTGSPGPKAQDARVQSFVPRLAR